MVDGYDHGALDLFIVVAFVGVGIILGNCIVNFVEATHHSTANQHACISFVIWGTDWSLWVYIPARRKVDTIMKWLRVWVVKDKEDRGQEIPMFFLEVYNF